MTSRLSIRHSGATFSHLARIGLGEGRPDLRHMGMHDPHRLPTDAPHTEPFESRLDPRDIEQLAMQVAELLANRPTPLHPARLADAATVACRLGVDRDWVYAHARELGGVRLGGERGRLRFDLTRVEQQLACPERPRPTRRKPRGT
jgi:hypothetical protein